MGQGALFHRSKQGFGTLFQHARHLQVQPVVVGSDGIVNRAPIRNHDALISPFAFQNIPQKLLIFAGINPIDFVVAGHDRPRGGFLHGDFEWAQIDFPQRPFIDDRVIDHAVILLAVAGEVLQARADVLVLQAVDIGRGHLPGQKGIFGKIFEVPSAEGIPFDIGSGGEQNVGLLKMRLFAQSPAKLTFKLDVPAARGQTRGRKANRDFADLKVEIRIVVHFPKPQRAIVHLNRLQFGSLHSKSEPRAIPGKKGSFFFVSQRFAAQFLFFHGFIISFSAPFWETSL